ncbi:cysteine dioxygenase family protein [Kitasatospora sp. NPDC048538]|uniref:cysteine dioxygenase family protein n=1 Tax=unclassified Kitasatospora TaxID=2633591 RepID=UPI00340EBFEF
MATATPTQSVAVSVRLVRLVESVRAAVRSCTSPAGTAAAVAHRLRPFLDHPDLLTPDQHEGDRAHYRQHVLHVEPDGTFSVVALVWYPGQRTAIHDHVSWCVTGVYEGVEQETRYREVPAGDGTRLVVTEELVNATGDVVGIAPPHDIHRVSNGGDRKAVSIHVYGADIGRLGSSIRRVYEDPAPTEG